MSTEGESEPTSPKPIAKEMPADVPQATKPRNRRRTAIGVVISSKMDKTLRVDVPRLAQHSKYGKYVKRRTICYVHDEKNEASAGDHVEIMETRPMSKSKRWRLVRVVRAAVGTVKRPASDADASTAPAE